MSMTVTIDETVVTVQLATVGPQGIQGPTGATGATGAGNTIYFANNFV